MAFVKECPKHLLEVQEASKRLNCDEDKYGNNRYLCLPNTEKTSLVEFCYNGTMGMQDKGNCLEASDGSLFLKDCRHFAFGCPEMHFRSTEFYTYPACQTIDIKRQCYILDSSCSSFEVDYGANTEEHTCSIAVWQVLLCLCLVAFISLLVIVIISRRLKKYDNDGFPEECPGQYSSLVEDGLTRQCNGQYSPLMEDGLTKQCNGQYSPLVEDSDLLLAEKDFSN